MSLEHHQIELKTGVSLHYVEQGPKHAPVVVLCHGWPEFWYCWHKQIPAIAAAGYRVIVPDLRGFGQTKILRGPTGREGYTFKVVQEDLIALLDILNIPNIFLIGHDWGGALVWNMARRFPKRISAVGSVCTPYTPRGDKFRPLSEIIEKIPQFAYQQFFSEQREFAASLMEKDVKHFFTLMFSKGTPLTHSETGTKGIDYDNKKERVGGIVELLKATEAPGKLLLAPDELEMYVNTFTKTGFKDCLHWYGTGELNYNQEVKDNLQREVHQPALMVTCGQDRILTPVLTTNMESWIPKLSRGHIEEAGHWVQTEEPEKLNTILIKWLNSLPSAPKSKL